MFVLGLLPELDLGEGGDEVWAAHEVEIRGSFVDDGIDGDDLAVDFLRTVSG